MMACDTRYLDRMTPVQRKKQIDEALERLNKALTLGEVKVTINRTTGALAFTGWTDASRAGVTDACAYRKLITQGSPALRAAIVRAEAMAGRKLNTQAIDAGVHSHDGGKSWGRH